MRRLAAAWCVLVALAAGTRASAEPVRDVGRRLHQLASDRGRYLSVRRQVIAWHGTTRNGCVAFASTALRAIGVDVPQDARIDGEGISRITRAFVVYLVETLGWTRIDRVQALAPGDLVFTTDAPCCPGYPAHVFVFTGWRDRARRVAWATDNQGFRRARRLLSRPGDETDGFAFALRAGARVRIPRP